MRIELVAADAAAPALLEAVGELTATAYLADGYLPAEDSYVSQLRDAAERAREAELWVAVGDNGVLLGSVTFCPVGSSYVEIAGADEGEFRMLCVSPAARGLGIGSNLVERCIQRAEALGYKAIRLSTLPTMTTAHRIYERLGFVRDEARDWSPKPGTALVAYSLSL